MIQTRSASVRAAVVGGLLGEHRVVGPRVGDGLGQPRLGCGVAGVLELGRGHVARTGPQVEQDLRCSGSQSDGDRAVVVGQRRERRAWARVSTFRWAARHSRDRRRTLGTGTKLPSSDADPGPRTALREGSDVSIEWSMAVGGLLVGIMVGLTGMGGGALMTPMLVFVFGVDPLTAISSDIVASLFMKPVGAAVHFRHGTINGRLVAWLCVGSVPAAFAGAYLISLVPSDYDLEFALKTLLGVALLTATVGLFVRALVQMWRNRLPLGEGPADFSRATVRIKPIPTLILGAVAGLMVGLTSVGAGSIVVVALLLMYPALKASSLVGTDLAQAIPLVAAAAFGHLLFGSFSLVVAGSILLGAIPGAYLGARMSSRAPGGLLRRILAIVLLATGLKLVGASTPVVIGATILAVLFAFVAWAWIRRQLEASAAAYATRRAAETTEPAVPSAAAGAAGAVDADGAAGTAGSAALDGAGQRVDHAAVTDASAQPDEQPERVAEGPA